MGANESVTIQNPLARVSGLHDPAEAFQKASVWVVKLFLDDKFLGVGCCVQHGRMISARHLYAARTGTKHEAEFRDGTRVPIELECEDSSLDFIVFRHYAKVPEVALDIAKFQPGEPYISIGFGTTAPDQVSKRWSYNIGVISTDYLDSRAYGLSGSGNFGDSGGPVFNLRTLKFMGMIVGGCSNDSRQEGVWVRSGALIWMTPTFAILQAYDEIRRSTAVPPISAHASTTRLLGHGPGDLPRLHPGIVLFNLPRAASQPKQKKQDGDGVKLLLRAARQSMNEGKDVVVDLSLNDPD